MQSFETPDYLDEDIPNLLFLDISFSFLIVTYFLEDITIVRIFHYQAIINEKTDEKNPVRKILKLQNKLHNILSLIHI